MSNKLKVWVLVDSRVGNSKQALALAEILGIPYVTKKIEYTILANLPNFLKVGLTGVSSESKKSLVGKPDIIISAGRRTASIAVHIKKHTGAKVIQIMYPGLSLDAVDVLILPHHDKKPNKKYLSKTFFIHGAVTHLDENVVKKHTKIWSPAFATLENPKIGVLLGGKSKHTNFTTVNAKALAKSLVTVVENYGGSLLIVSSRRTPPKSIEALQQYLDQKGDIPYFIYKYHENKKKNPYYAVLGLSDRIVVTGDSVSMCSESIQMGKPVYIFAAENMLGKKHRKYIDHLFDNGLAAPLYENYKPFLPKKNSENKALKKQLLEVLKEI